MLLVIIVNDVCPPIPFYVPPIPVYSLGPHMLPMSPSALPILSYGTFYAPCPSFPPANEVVGG